MSGSPVARIVLVEDSAIHVQLVQMGLDTAHMPFHLRVIRTGDAALAGFRCDGEVAGDRPDLVLLDLHLPGCSGHEVLSAIRATPATRTVPVVVLSSSDDPGDCDEAYRRGANAFAGKPDDIDEFMDTVRKIADYFLGAVSARS